MLLAPVVVAALELASCSKASPTNPSVPASIPQPSGAVDGRIVFTSTRDGSWGVYVAEGEQVRRVAEGRHPKWSPDGRQLAFDRLMGGVYGIYVINNDGSGERYLGPGGGPDWSPDGRQIVFSRTEALSEGGSLFVMNAEGTAVTKLVDSAFVQAGDALHMTAWSPDGRTIAFIRSNYYDAWDLHLVNSDGTNPRPLRGPQCATNPSWSPDSSLISCANRGGVFNIDANGAGSRMVVVGQRFDPAWTSDGRLSYSKETGQGPTAFGGLELRIFVNEGGVERRLVPEVVTSQKYSDHDVDWAP